MAPVSVLGTSDYYQIIGTFSVTVMCGVLPVQLVYEGKINQPKFNFPKEYCITQTPSHWENEDTSIAMLDEILIQYIKGKQK